MGLFIKGVDLPHEGFTQIFVFPSGQASVFKYFSLLGEPNHKAAMEQDLETIEVPDELDIDAMSRYCEAAVRIGEGYPIDAQTLRKIFEENANGDSSSQLS